ncbi:type II secretion system protein [Massilia horti]|uniref:Type II secretion system protein n=1 Tax=Massilia horti TaxID=2562153 RepID=A0A4Y9SPD7_9BURK|nr:type II secretion system protein [Massilia horti]TFW28401.1 type II secretion system protein [Massilia horti]
MQQPREPRREAGFTYLGLIILLTIIGLVGAAALKVDALLRRAAAEEELLEIGAAFSAALQSYADATPKGQPKLPPPTLQELLKDSRFPGVHRHLRKIFVDPVTGKAEWGILYEGDRVGVLAVYSLSSAKPLKVANFDARFQNFENKEHISDWKFTANGQGVQQPLAPSATPGSNPLIPPEQAVKAPVQPDHASQAPEPRDKPNPPTPPEPSEQSEAEPPADAADPPKEGDNAPRAHPAESETS